MLVVPTVLCRARKNRVLGHYTQSDDLKSHEVVHEN